MNALRELELKIRSVSEDARRYGAPIAAERLQEASLLLISPQLDSFSLDLIPRLLDSSLIRQEIEVVTMRRVGRWYTLLLFLPILTLITILLTIIAYLGWWPTVFNNAIAPILSLSIPTGFILVSLCVFSFWRIHWLKHRANQTCAELSLQLQDITRGFLLSATNNSHFFRASSDTLNTVAYDIRQAITQLVRNSREAFQELINTNQVTVRTIQESSDRANKNAAQVIQELDIEVEGWMTSFDQATKKLISTNQDAVQAIQGLNAEVKTRVGAFDGQITPALVNFSSDITVFRSTISDYQTQIAQVNTELTTVLRQLANTNEARLNIEQDLGTQVEMLREIQQKTVDRTEAIVTAMSSTTQSVINIADRLARQQHQNSSGLPSVLQADGNSDEREVEHVFDVFLSYSTEDRSTVKAIAEQLKARGIVPWLDEWEMRPGVSWQRLLGDQIPYIKSAAVFVGNGHSGPWQNKEMRAILREFVRRDSLIIPVILPECDQVAPELPAFLGATSWVDFRQKDPNPLETLSWGITGRRVLA